jgi:hypothetical protein
MTPTDRDRDRMRILVAWALCDGYAAYHRDFVNECAVIESETDFIVPLRNPLTNAVSTSRALKGRADKLIRYNGKLWLVDHKSTSRMPDREFLKINAQGDTYILAYQERGFAVEGIVWDYVRKPSIKKTQKETPDEYVARLRADISERPDFYFSQFLVKRWPEDIKSSQYDVWMTHQLLLGCHRTKQWPRNTNACNGLYGTCEFLPLCAEDNEITRAAYCKRQCDEQCDHRLESYSSLSQFRGCPRLYYWRQVENIEPIDIKEALSQGREIHAGLDVVYARGDLHKHFTDRLATLVSSSV